MARKGDDDAPYWVSGRGEAPKLIRLAVVVRSPTDSLDLRQEIREAVYSGKRMLDDSYRMLKRHLEKFPRVTLETVSSTKDEDGYDPKLGKVEDIRVYIDIRSDRVNDTSSYLTAALTSHFIFICPSNDEQGEGVYPIKGAPASAVVRLQGLDRGQSSALEEIALITHDVAMEISLYYGMGLAPEIVGPPADFKKLKWDCIQTRAEESRPWGIPIQEPDLPRYLPIASLVPSGSVPWTPTESEEAVEAWRDLKIEVATRISSGKLPGPVDEVLRVKEAFYFGGSLSPRGLGKQLDEARRREPAEDFFYLCSAIRRPDTKITRQAVAVAFGRQQWRQHMSIVRSRSEIRRLFTGLIEHIVLFRVFPPPLN